MNDNEKLKRAVKAQKLQIKALLVPNPKQIDQSVFLGQDESLVHAFVNSFGEAWLSPAPIEDCVCDDEAWTTSMDYPAGQKIGSGFDPRGWQDSLIVRQQEELLFQPTRMAELHAQKQALDEMTQQPTSKVKRIYDRAINIYCFIKD